MDQKNYKLQENLNIDELAEIAHIALSQQEKQRIEGEIREFIEFSTCMEDSLQPFECGEGISPDALRDDVAVFETSPERITALSGSFVDGFYRVSRTVGAEKEGEK